MIYFSKMTELQYKPVRYKSVSVQRIYSALRLTLEGQIPVESGVP